MKDFRDDLLVMTVGGVEDLRIIKLILLVFEGLSGLETNFTKTCLYSTNMHHLPLDGEAKTVNCGVGLLHVTYLVSRFRVEGRVNRTGRV